MPALAIEYCSSCRFFAGAEGECRIRAPEVIPVSVDIDPKPGIALPIYGKTTWPSVPLTGWCGEWTKK